jgi:hypothetical protein
MPMSDGRKRKNHDKASLFQLPWSKTEWAPLPRVAATPATPATRTETARRDASDPSTVSTGTSTRRERQRAREVRERVRRASENALAVGAPVTDPEALYAIARRACFAKPAHDTDDTRGGVQAGLDAAERASGGNMPPGRWFEDRLVKEWNDGFTARRKREVAREAGERKPVPPRLRAALRVKEAVEAALEKPGVFAVPANVNRATWWTVTVAPPAPGSGRVPRFTTPPPRKRRGVRITVTVTPRILPAVVAGTAWGKGWLLLDIEPDGTRLVAHQHAAREFTYTKEPTP